MKRHHRFPVLHIPVQGFANRKVGDRKIRDIFLPYLFLPGVLPISAAPRNQPGPSSFAPPIE